MSITKKIFVPLCLSVRYFGLRPIGLIPWFPVTKNKVRTWLWFDVVRGKEALTGKA